MNVDFEKIYSGASPDTQGYWSDPIPLDGDADRAEFPVDALPEPGCKMVRSVAEVNQVDAGLAGTIFLSILSACLAKQGVVDLGTHREPINLYLCPILPSGERKSSTMSVMSRPITDYERNTGTIITVDDVTPEKLGSLMTANGERLAILSSEGGIFEIMAGRYSKKVANLDLFLKAHAGDPWSCLRISRDMEMMTSPALTMCLTVQPQVIKMLGSNRQLKDTGLVARFLYSLCKPQAGFRKRHGIVMDEALVHLYNNHIVGLLNLPMKDRILDVTTRSEKMGWVLR